MPKMERTQGNEYAFHSSSGFNARGLKNGDTDSDDDEDDAIGVMIYNSSRTVPGVHFTWGEGQGTGPRDTWNLHPELFGN